MIIKKARQILGSEAEGQTDEQIQEIINTASFFSDIAIEQFLKKPAGSKLIIK